MSRRTTWTVLGVIVIIGFIAFGAGAFKASLTPYVSFQQARATAESVQVAGALVPGSEHFDEEASRLFFTIEDEQGDTLQIAYSGLKPGNFNESTQVVAIGRFKDGVLETEKLLVKCPSMYQGTEDEYLGTSST